MVKVLGRARRRGGLAAEEEKIDVVERLAFYDLLGPAAPTPHNVVIAAWTSEVVEVDMWPGASLAKRWAGRVHELPSTAAGTATSSRAPAPAVGAAADDAEEAAAELWAIAELRAVAG